jgi:Ti-type conjugative transfer relaxase TraA
MAICFAHTEIIHAADDSSANGMSAYISRAKRKDIFSGRSFNFSRQAADLINREVILPLGAPERFRDAQTLWAEATKKETTQDRRRRRVRFKKDAEVAKHTILALPKELNDTERLELTRRFIQDNFTKFGVVVEFAIHRPDADSPDNYHAHLLITTRLVNKNGFGKKARKLNPGFSTDRKRRRLVSDQDFISDRWAQAQNTFFNELGLDLCVDPKRQVAAIHVGPSWHAPDNERREKAAEADAAAAALMRDPAAILRGINKPIFTVRDLSKHVARHGLKGAERDEAVQAALAHPEIVRLHDPTGRELFTTREGRAREFRILEHGDKVSSASAALAAEVVEAMADRYTLDPEQREALRFLTSGRGLQIMIGRAGTGKTRVLSAARAAYEASSSGFSVRGLAPTNTAAMSLKDDGFDNASTLHRAMYRLRRGFERWDRRTILIVDEAAMVDAEMYDQFLKAAADAGATVILTGDDRQFSSVKKSGIFPELTKRFGAAELRRVRRQQSDWQREASQSFARGETSRGLKPYSERGFLLWNETIDDSRARLVNDWSSDRDQESVKFIYASTNAEVDRINASAQALRRERGEIGYGQWLETTRGHVELSTGDRLQFYANDRRAGIFNGDVGTVSAVGPRRVEVITDSGTTVLFDPTQFKKWGLGYCGTLYRAQGKTKLNVFAFFDNPYAWNSKAAYVAMTRHTAQVRLYASRDLAADEATLAHLMSRVSDDGASIRYETVDDQSSVLSRLDKQLKDLRLRMGLGEHPDLNTFLSPALSGIHAPRKRITSAKRRKLEPPRRPR